jgi:5-methylcytosine-specific restriction enzyme subunit McrC
VTRLALRHLSEGDVLTGVELTRAEAAALSGTRLVTATPVAEGWKVAAGQWVGAIRCGDLEVRVAPKVGAVRVLELLARASGVHRLLVDRERLGLADDADLSAVLAVLFEREAQRVLALRPPHGYRTQDQSLPVVRGRIRLVDQALRRFGAVTPIEVTVDEWTPTRTGDCARQRRSFCGCPACRSPSWAACAGSTGCSRGSTSRRAAPSSPRGHRPA